MNREEELFNILLNEKEKYTLIINKKAPNNELMLLKVGSLEGAQKYYPNKDFVILIERDNLKVCLEKIKELKLTDYDVVFLDTLNFQDFYITIRYLNLYTTVRSIIMDSALRKEKEKKEGKIEEKIKEEIDQVAEKYELTALDELLLGKKIDAIKDYAKEKNISINLL